MVEIQHNLFNHLYSSVYGIRVLGWSQPSSAARSSPEISVAFLHKTWNMYRCGWRYRRSGCVMSQKPRNINRSRNYIFSDKSLQSDTVVLLSCRSCIKQARKYPQTFQNIVAEWLWGSLGTGSESGHLYSQKWPQNRNFSEHLQLNSSVLVLSAKKEKRLFEEHISAALHHKRE